MIQRIHIRYAALVIGKEICSLETTGTVEPKPLSAGSFRIKKVIFTNFFVLLALAVWQNSSKNKKFEKIPKLREPLHLCILYRYIYVSQVYE